MPFRVLGAIAPVTIEGVGGLLEDLCAGLFGALEVLVDVRDVT
jgi:hypothetical protein